MRAASRVAVALGVAVGLAGAGAVAAEHTLGALDALAGQVWAATAPPSA